MFLEACPCCRCLALCWALCALKHACSLCALLLRLQELRERFSSVAQAAAEAAYFSGQDAQGGVLAHLAAKLAAKLKVGITLQAQRWLYTLAVYIGVLKRSGM